MCFFYYIRYSCGHNSPETYVDRAGCHYGGNCR
jgi:hypothetical protein